MNPSGFYVDPSRIPQFFTLLPLSLYCPGFTKEWVKQKERGLFVLAPFVGC